MLADLTLLLAWNAQEAGKIIETYKVFEYKPPDLIMEKQENSNAFTEVMSDFISKIVSEANLFIFLFISASRFLMHLLQSNQSTGRM